MTDETRDVRLDRWFKAPIESVWAAFTDPDQLARWYGPRGVEVDPASVDVGDDVGGAWALTMKVGDKTMPLRGTITGLERPYRLVVTDELPRWLGCDHDNRTSRRGRRNPACAPARAVPDARR